MKLALTEIKKEISKLKCGEFFHWDLGEEASMEVWLKHDRYFLFAVPQFGGWPYYVHSFSEHEIDRLDEFMEGYT